LIVGDSGSGKSCLLLRFSDDIFTENFISSIGVDFKANSVNVDGTDVKLQIWDTAGQERFRTITSSYYRGAQGIIIVYDVTVQKSFEAIDKWVKEINTFAEPGICKVLVGNKTDLDDRLVTTEQGQEKASSMGVPFMETSAKDNLNVNETFRLIAGNIKTKFIDA